jgi:GTP-binding protein
MGTLLDHSYRKRYKAENGRPGEGRQKTGRQGKNCVIPVPLGTQAFDVEAESLLADITAAGQQAVVAKGGRGGFGNKHYATSTNQAPRRSDPGQTGEQRRVRLVLKLMADVGLVGFPNVGKSTLLSVVSRARPKIADYPFTTVAPNLGVVDLADDRAVVIADVPGLIEGASTGRGLGIRFLKHLERTAVLLHLVTFLPEENNDPVSDWEAVRKEIEAHGKGLAEKPEIVAVTKMDLPSVSDAFSDLEKRFAARGVDLLPLCAPTRQGLQETLERLWETVHQSRVQA